MSVDSPKRPKFLAVVKEPTSEPRTRVVSLEKLTPEQAEKVRLYQQVVNPSGVLVGVVQGQAEWDLRPLILSKGSITITRFVSPQFQRQPSRVTEFQTYLSRTGGLSAREVDISFRSQGELFWVTRRYFNAVLEEVRIDPGEVRKLVKAFIDSLDRLHQEGLVHGHISPSNLALDSGKLLLFDFGFHLFDPTENTLVPDLAPEVRSGGVGAVLSPASDMFGLGVVISSLLRDELGEYATLVALMLDKDPLKRPLLSQVKEVFGGGRILSAPLPPPISEPVVPQAVSAPSPNPLPIPQPSVPTPPAPIGGKEIRIRLPHGSTPLYIVIGFLAILLLREPIRSLFASRSSGSITPNNTGSFDTYWRSSQPSLMQQVARAALQGDEMAMLTIVQSVMQGDKHPMVQSALLRKAFNPLWEGELRAEDKSAVLKLALSTLIPADQRSIPALEELHPGVIVALLSEMGIDSSNPQLRGVVISRLQDLPLPFGPPFAALGRLGVGTLENSASQALAHILFADVSEKVILGFFPPDDEMAVSLAKLDILIPLFDTIPGLDNAIYGTLIEKAESGGRVFGWFAKDQLVGWKQIASREKLLMLSGVFPDRKLSAEQLTDLLRFPRLNIRDRAKAALIELLGESYAPIVAYLAGPESRFTRAQTIALLSSFRIKSDAAYSFVSQWFDTAPDATSVLQVLLLRSAAPDTDPFNVEASRYLSNREDWNPGLEEVKKLIVHGEPLARTLGYARLHKAVPEELQLLRRAAEEEPNEKIKSQLQERLTED